MAAATRMIITGSKPESAGGPNNKSVTTMHLTPRSPAPARSGYVLIIIMAFLAVSLAAFSSMMYWSASSAKNTLRNNYFNMAENAAESATENIMATMIRDFNNGNLNASSTYQSLVPPTNGWPIAYQFSDTNGNTAYSATVSVGTVPSTSSPLSSQFSGLYGFPQPTTITSTATPQNTGVTLSATVSQFVQFALIPLFQFAIFYNMDLEINPGAGMNINGHVHSNNNIWATGSSSGSPLEFADIVDAAGSISNVSGPLDPQNNRSGNVTYDDPNSPLPNYDTLTLPVGTSTNNNATNVLAILYPPIAAYAPPNFAAAYSTNGQSYLENDVDLIITNSANGVAGSRSGTNILVYYQNSAATTQIAPVPPDVYVVTNKVSHTTTTVSSVSGSQLTNIVYATYSFVTNASFYDYREANTVQSLDINVDKLNTWLANNSTNGGGTWNTANTTGSTSKNHQINSIYAYNGVPNTSTVLPAVRMINGQQLPPAGLTVVTPQPMYVKGDYNTTTNGNSTFSTALGDTTNTAPAALMADAITILSSSWSDSWTSGTSLGSRDVGPNRATINAAALEGIVPSNGVNYSGGVENFLRLLESWSGTTLVYNGSIVVMFPSQYATSPWQQTGIYYNPPTRTWGFDVNFLTSNRLPPITPRVKGVIRGTWAAW
jgi:hypothetical protein